MNSSIYIFGNLSSGYTVYPDEDSSSNIFQKFYNKAKATTQIAIHRDNNLMYYAYIRKLEQEKYLGLCVLLNDMALTHFEGLFSLFENVISNLVINGYLIKFDDNGNLVANTDHLYMSREEVDLVTTSLKAAFENMQSSTVELPPVNYAVSSESTKEFSIEDNEEDILNSSYTNGYTYIYKSKGYNTIFMNSYKGVLSRIKNENTTLKEENENLKNENRKIRQQKQNFSYVILLCLAIIGCGVGLFFLNDSLNTTQEELTLKLNELDDAQNTITGLQSQITDLESSLSDEKKKRKEAESQINDIKDTYPILITDIKVGNVYSDNSIETDYGNPIYSFNSMYLRPRITYTGIKSGEEITLNVKLYGISGTLQTGSNSPRGYTYSDNMTISSGSNNTYTLKGWGRSNEGNWSSGTYRYEIWYGNICLGAKTFTIY